MTVSNTVTDEDMESLRHMLGASVHIKKSRWGYRNYFAAGAGQVESMERLVAAGYAFKGSKPFDLTYYHATEAGMDAIGMSKAAKRRAAE